MNIYLFATKKMYQHIQQKLCNVKVNTNLSNLVFIRKKNGSAMILLMKYTKIQDLETEAVCLQSLWSKSFWALW